MCVVVVYFISNCSGASSYVLSGIGLSAEFISNAHPCSPAHTISVLSKTKGDGSTVPTGTSSIIRATVTVFCAMSWSSACS